MARTRDTGPYIWVTWVSKLMTGDASCEWAAWFKAQHEGNSWTRMPSDFDQVAWLTAHTDLLNSISHDREANGYSVSVEGQNSMTLQGRSAALAGKPDLISRKGDIVTVIDAKTGQVRVRAHGSPGNPIHVRMLPRAIEEFTRALVINGTVSPIRDHVVWTCPQNSVDQEFRKARWGRTDKEVGSEYSGEKGAQLRESAGGATSLKADCPERADGRGPWRGNDGRLLGGRVRTAPASAAFRSRRICAGGTTRRRDGNQPRRLHHKGIYRASDRSRFQT